MVSGVHGPQHIGRPSPGPVEPSRPQSSPGEARPFREVLGQTARPPELRFSAHALERIRGRNINLSPSDLERLNRAVEWAAAKGARDSLVIFNDLAFVVSVENRTVVTALDRVRERVFTQIDSAVVL